METSQFNWKMHTKTIVAFALVLLQVNFILFFNNSQLNNVFWFQVSLTVAAPFFKKAAAIVLGAYAGAKLASHVG